MSDVRIFKVGDGVRAVVQAESEPGEAFVDAWLFGTLSVEDAGAITVTTEVLGDLTTAARERGLTVATS